MYQTAKNITAVALRAGLLAAMSAAMLAGCSNPPPGLSLSLNPANATINPGQAVMLEVTLAAQNFSGTINFALENLADTATLSPSSLTVQSGQPTKTTFTLQTAAKIASGTFPFTIVARSGSLQTAGVFNLTVR
jgi:uncharacterized membrane protein